MREVRTLMDQVYAPVVPFFLTSNKGADGAAVGEVFKAAVEAATATFKSSSSVSTSTTSAAAAATASSATLLGMELPESVQLVTLEAVSNSQLLVRLAHQFAAGEDAQLSAAVEVDLFALLAPYAPVSAEEMTLSANQNKAEQLAHKVHWNTEGANKSSAAAATITTAAAADVASATAGGVSRSLRGGGSSAAASTASYVLLLQPMQIKTFLVQLQQ